MSDDEALRAFRAKTAERKIHKIDSVKAAAEVKRLICGQDDTIDLMVEQIRNGFVSNPKWREGPIGVFMLLGPPGTGKTSLAKALADAVIDGDGGFYTVDMNSCRDEHSAWTYFGSAQGLTGGRGVLTTAIASRRGAPMLILLDEFEKAEQAVHRMFLSAWATGFIVDNRDGNQIDTRNTIWVLTSNAQQQMVQQLKAQLRNDRDKFNEELRRLLEKKQDGSPLFPSEVLSRINEFFCLEPLGFTESDERGVLVGFQLIRNILTKLANEYDLALIEANIAPDALAGTLHKLTTTFEDGGIRSLRVWLKRQLSSTLVDLRLSGVTQLRIDQAPDLKPGEFKLLASDAGASRNAS